MISNSVYMVQMTRPQDIIIAPPLNIYGWVSVVRQGHAATLTLYNIIVLNNASNYFALSIILLVSSIFLSIFEGTSPGHMVE